VTTSTYLPSENLAAASARFLLIDDCQAFVEGLSRSLRTFGHTPWIAKTFPEAIVMAEVCEFDYVVSELRIDGHFIFEFLPNLGRRQALDRLAIVTTYPSVATAVKLVKLGVGAYFTKPVSAPTLLSEFGRREKVSLADDGEEAYPWPTLNRTIWEYLNQVYVTAGTMSEAARRLGLDRRSLRRMLAKYPPAR
jgi:two-component system response regulator RegA